MHRPDQVVVHAIVIKASWVIADPPLRRRRRWPRVLCERRRSASPPHRRGVLTLQHALVVSRSIGRRRVQKVVRDTVWLRCGSNAGATSQRRVRRGRKRGGGHAVIAAVPLHARFRAHDVHDKERGPWHDTGVVYNAWGGGGARSDQATPWLGLLGERTPFSGQERNVGRQMRRVHLSSPAPGRPDASVWRPRVRSRRRRTRDPSRVCSLPACTRPWGPRPLSGRRRCLPCVRWNRERAPSACAPRAAYVVSVPALSTRSACAGIMTTAV